MELAKKNLLDAQTPFRRDFVRDHRARSLQEDSTLFEAGADCNGKRKERKKKRSSSNLLYFLSLLPQIRSNAQGDVCLSFAQGNFVIDTRATTPLTVCPTKACANNLAIKQKQQFV